MLSCIKLIGFLSYHIAQALNRALGGGKSEEKDAIRKAIKEHDKDALILLLDTYESTLEDELDVRKIHAFRTYILNHWDRLYDWREQVESPPAGARNLGAMESNQRHISFRMKKRGMHWSPKGCEAMVKVKQGILNKTLRAVYLQHQNRSVRKKREVKQTVRLAQLLREQTRPSTGVKRGTISLHASYSSTIGKLVKSIR